MLRELHIENVAVIERADLELGPGLNILTGETGAGKSILVDAMHAILGARASRELVRTGAEKAVVCATFDPDPCRDWCEENEIECDDELIIRRQITAEGKTSCRVCGVPVTTAQLRTLGALLLDIHGQNDGSTCLTSGSTCAIWIDSASWSRSLHATVSSIGHTRHCARSVTRSRLMKMKKNC